jgi:CheY-like chemotaxis protein
MASRLLVVDDEPRTGEALCGALTLEGYDVALATDGAAALRWLEEQRRAGARPTDVILLDMRMPVMNGWEFARAFAERYGRAAPIVVVTAAENARARADEIGAEGWIEKPFDLEDVVEAVARRLGPPAPAAGAR